MPYAVIQPPKITLICSVPAFLKPDILTKSLWWNRSSKKCTGFKLHRLLEHGGLQFSISWWSTIFNLWTTKDFSSALQRLAKRLTLFAAVIRHLLYCVRGSLQFFTICGKWNEEGLISRFRLSLASITFCQNGKIRTPVRASCINKVKVLTRKCEPDLKRGFTAK